MQCIGYITTEVWKERTWRSERMLSDMLRLGRAQIGGGRRLREVKVGLGFKLVGWLGDEVEGNDLGDLLLG